jgi:glycosyltransferase involved in cell wall biosynthesis
MHLFVIGCPSDIGGANTELWHTVKLWRRFGLGVTLIPTWKADPAWRRRLDAIGCCTCQSNPDDLKNVPGLAGSVVVSLCNTRFLAVAERFRKLRCKIVWLGCMNWLFPEERIYYRKHGCFDRHVFQSGYQCAELRPQLAKYGYDDLRGQVIRGAFDVEEFPFRPRPHAPREPFVIGRLSRAAADKFSPNTWNAYARVPHPIAARVMGWHASVEARLGRPPRWAECLPAGAETSQTFLARLHCLAQAGGAAVENWPRVALEAMAAGVPVVAENRGGWREMIRHDQTGCLCNDDDEMACCIGRLAHNAAYRRQIVEQARYALETDLANPETWRSRWQELLESLT